MSKGKKVREVVKFLLDENIPKRSAMPRLKSGAYLQVRHIKYDLGQGGAKDSILWNLSRNEKFVIVTSDKDFLPKKVSKNTAVIFISGGGQMRNEKIQFSVSRGMTIFKSFSDYQGKIIKIHQKCYDIYSYDSSKIKRINF